MLNMVILNLGNSEFLPQAMNSIKFRRRLKIDSGSKSKDYRLKKYIIK